MSNSSLICYTKLSPNCTKPRNHCIDTISIHCVAGNLSVKACLSLSRFVTYDAVNGASCNYAVDSYGNIGLGVEEANRAWCTSSRTNDNRAITIEVANCGGSDEGWPVTDAALAALIDLVTDICKRNGIKKLLWQANPDLIGQVDQQNMTVHRWFAAKACPGDYLFNKHYYITEEVNKRLNKEEDDMAKVIEQIAVNAGCTTDEAIERLGLVVKFQDTFLDKYQQDGVAKLKELGFISVDRDGRAQVNWGDMGTVLARIYDKTK